MQKKIDLPKPTRRYVTVVPTEQIRNANPLVLTGKSIYTRDSHGSLRRVK